MKTPNEAMGEILEDKDLNQSLIPKFMYQQQLLQ
jgi:hypothetical protein